MYPIQIAIERSSNPDFFTLAILLVLLIFGAYFFYNLVILKFDKFRVVKKLKKTAWHNDAFEWNTVHARLCDCVYSVFDSWNKSDNTISRPYMIAEAWQQ